MSNRHLPMFNNDPDADMIELEDRTTLMLVTTTGDRVQLNIRADLFEPLTLSRFEAEKLRDALNLALAAIAP